VVATLLPAILYGMQFWRPSRAQLRTLQRLIVWPLRLSLHLPIDTNHLSILTEYNLLPLDLQRQLAVLRYAHRSASLPHAHPCHQLLSIPTVDTKILFCRPFFDEVAEICDAWGIPWRRVDLISSDTLSARAYEQLQFRFDASSASLKAALPRLHSDLLHTYLFHAVKPAVSSFARLRFNRARTGAFLFSRRLSDSPFCPDCPNTPQTVHHLIFDCARFAARRRICFDSIISIIDCPLSFSLLLGDYSSVPKARIPDVHRVVSAFVTSIVAASH
jgi:hypothetical protein